MGLWERLVGWLVELPERAANWTADGFAEVFVVSLGLLGVGVCLGGLLDSSLWGGGVA